MYGDAALSRLQTILLFRELEFPLKEIKAILDSPDFDVSEALSQQIRLLELQYKHLGELIAFTREIQNKGVTAMRFDVFDRSEIAQYEAEVKARWGGTRAYQEYRQRKAARNGDGSRMAEELTAMFSQLGELKHLRPDGDEVQRRIAALQKWITGSCYLCTNEILSGLGEMYVCDERFRSSIDRAGEMEPLILSSRRLPCIAAGRKAGRAGNENPGAPHTKPLPMSCQTRSGRL